MQIFHSTMHATGLTTCSHTSRSAISTRPLPPRQSRRGLSVRAILNTKPSIKNLGDVQVLKDLKTDGGLESLELRDVQVGRARGQLSVVIVAGMLSADMLHCFCELLSRGLSPW